MRSAIRLAVSVALVAVVAAAPSQAFVPGWVSGDLHVHTTYSHDVCGTPPTPENCHPEDPSEPYTWGWTPAEQIANAEARGLDFLALTDHNTVAQQTDPGYASGRLVLVPGYENSLRAHAQMLGATRLYPGPSETIGDIAQIATALRGDGGAFQINHPGDRGTRPGNWPTKYGADPSAFQPETVEVWNIGAWYYQPPMPASNNNDYAVRFWESFLDAGYHVAATGGSDNHWRSTSCCQGVGQPTTWVYVTERTAAGILAGLRAGRTSISSQPPALGGARAYLEALSGGSTIGMVGDAVPRSSTFRVRVEGASGNAVRVVGTGARALQLFVADGPSFEATFTVTDPAVTWMRAEVFVPDAREPRTTVCPAEVNAQTTYCANRLSMTAMTSAIYLT